MSWLRLIRWKNLLIIFFTQLLAWWCVIRPDAWRPAILGVRTLLTPGNFLLLSLSTVCIAAAGYIINDYFDIKIDVINKPEKVILERTISLKTAILFHTILNLIGLFLAAVVAAQAGHYEWLIIQFACTILLWFYSTRFKRQFMIGNIVVALLSSLTIIVLMIYEPAMHYFFTRPMFDVITGEFFPLNPVWLLVIYSFFAFIISWMREIVKDMEDFKGDIEEGCITMPIKWGLERSVRFTQVLGIISVIVLVLSGVAVAQTSDWLLDIYIALALIFPLIRWIRFINKKVTKEHYNKASAQLKLIMVLGIGSLIIHYLIECFI